MRLFHTREVIQDLDGIVLRDDPGAGTLTFDLVAPPVFPAPPPAPPFLPSRGQSFSLSKNKLDTHLILTVRACVLEQVVANILVGPLMKLAPILSLACKVGGRLVSVCQTYCQSLYSINVYVYMHIFSYAEK